MNKSLLVFLIMLLEFSHDQILAQKMYRKVGQEEYEAKHRRTILSIEKETMRLLDNNLLNLNRTLNDSTWKKTDNEHMKLSRKMFSIRGSILGPFLFNLGFKYRISSYVNLSCDIPMIPRYLFKDGYFRISGAISTSNYDSDSSFFFGDIETGLSMGNLHFFLAKTPTFYTALYIEGSVGIRTGLFLFLKVGPAFQFGIPENWSFSGELGGGWNF
jgi:hypothetical protein